jgi:hypothetical protein
MITTVCVLLSGTVRSAEAGAVRTNAGFTTSSLPGNDDDSTGQVPIGFTINFFGQDYSSLYVNNNGNVTFDGPLEDYVPFDLTKTAHVIIAAFFADIDTTLEPSGIVTYGTDTVNGRPAFGANYLNVGYYSEHTDKLNSFQIVLIDRSDVEPKAFDVELNYDSILWDLTDSSEGSEPGPRAGFSNGGDKALELDGSGVSGAWLDGSPTALVSDNRDAPSQPGRFLFAVRGGTITCKKDKECNDRISCTSNVCSPSDPAADGFGCVFASTCVSSNPCQTSNCDRQANACVSVPKPDQPTISCDNGSRCGFDQCEAGTCVDPQACESIIAPETTATTAIKITCESVDGTADKGDYCEGRGVVGGVARTASGEFITADEAVVVTKKIRKKLNAKNGKAVLQLKLNKTGKKLLKQTSPLPVTVELTVASHGDTSLVRQFVDVIRKKK